MDMDTHYPESCWREGDCEGTTREKCGYLEMRKPSKYLLRKLKSINEFCERF